MTTEQINSHFSKTATYVDQRPGASPEHRLKFLHAKSHNYGFGHRENVARFQRYISGVPHATVVVSPSEFHNIKAI